MKVPDDTKMGLRANSIGCNSGPEVFNWEKWIYSCPWMFTGLETVSHFTD